MLKGPTAAFMEFAARDCSAGGVRDFYGELLDGIVADEDVGGVALLRTDTRMDGAEGRMRLARAAVTFAEGLAEAPGGDAPGTPDG